MKRLWHKTIDPLKQLERREVFRASSTCATVLQFQRSAEIQDVIKTAEKAARQVRRLQQR